MTSFSRSLRDCLVQAAVVAPDAPKALTAQLTAQIRPPEVSLVRSGAKANTPSASGPGLPSQTKVADKIPANSVPVIADANTRCSELRCTMNTYTYAHKVTLRLGDQQVTNRDEQPSDAQMAEAAAWPLPGADHVIGKTIRLGGGRI